MTKEKMTNEIAVFDPTAGFTPEDNLEGVEPSLPKIEIVHKMQMFKVEGDEDPVRSIVGTIIDSNKINAYWLKSIDEGGAGNAPDCFSNNGINSDQSSPARQSNSCLTCKQNQFGTGKEGVGKACKNMRRIHLMVDGNVLPLRLSMTGSSFKNFDAYMVQLTNQKLNYWWVKTKISLKEAKSKGGIEFSKVDFEKVGVVQDAETANQIDVWKEKFAPLMRSTVIEDEEGGNTNGSVNNESNDGAESQVDPF